MSVGDFVDEATISNSVLRRWSKPFHVHCFHCLPDRLFPGITSFSRLSCHAALRDQSICYHTSQCVFRHIFIPAFLIRWVLSLLLMAKYLIIYNPSFQLLLFFIGRLAAIASCGVLCFTVDVLFVCLFLALCSMIFPSSLGQSPWNFARWLDLCALRQCGSQNVGESPEKKCVGNCRILVLRGCCLLKFLHVLQNDQDLLVHVISGTGVSQQFLTMKIPKLAQNSLYECQ